MGAMGIPAGYGGAGEVSGAVGGRSCQRRGRITVIITAIGAAHLYLDPGLLDRRTVGELY
jgi:hypothetical protein